MFRPQCIQKHGNESINLTAPSTQGTYYYGACVDAVTGEDGYD